MRKHLLAVAAVMALALAGAAVGALAGRTVASKTTIKVTEREYRISLSRSSIPTGTVQLVVHNAGLIAHRLSVKGLGVSASTPLIEPGATKTLSLNVKHGSYSLWCPLGHHAAAGMKTSLAVGGAAPVAPIVTTTSTSTTPAGGGYDTGGNGY